MCEINYFSRKDGFTKVIKYYVAKQYILNANEILNDTVKYPKAIIVVAKIAHSTRSTSSVCTKGNYDVSIICEGNIGTTREPTRAT